MLQNRRIIWPSYLIAFSLSIIPPIDALMQTLPMRFGDPRWRWGAFGLMSNAMMIPMIGVLIAFVVATLFEQHLFRRILGVLTAVLAVGTLIGLGMFALDTVQLHKQVQERGLLAFRVAALTATTKSIVGMLTLAGFSWTAFTGPKRREKATASGIIIGGARPSKASPPAAPTPAAAPGAVEVK
jgi:hypothetical protein